MSITIYSSEKILPYVYFGVHKESGHFYFGSRTSKRQKYPSNIDILKYKTSSKYVKELGFHNFEWFIVAEFFDQLSALEFEYECIENTISDKLSLNFHNGGTKYSTAGLTNSKLHREKISKSDYSSRRGKKSWHNNRKGSMWFHSDLRDYMLFEDDPLIKTLDLRKGRKHQNSKFELADNLSNEEKIIKYTNSKINKYEKTIHKGSKLYHSSSGDHYQLNDNDPRISELNLTLGKYPGSHHKATLGTKWYHDVSGKTYSLRSDDPRIIELSLIIGRKK